MSYWIMYPAFLPLLCFSVFFLSVREYGLSYLSLRTCIGLWTAFFCLLLVATDASSLVCYITRFTEEAFAALICIIFIYEALEKLLHLGVHYPINKNNNLQKLTLYSYVHFSYSSCTVCLTQHICSHVLKSFAVSRNGRWYSTVSGMLFIFFRHGLCFMMNNPMLSVCQDGSSCFKLASGYVKPKAPSVSFYSGVVDSRVGWHLVSINASRMS